MKPLSQWVDFNPNVKLEKGKEYPFIGMDQLTPGIRYVRHNQRKIYLSGGTKFCNGDVLFARITPCLQNGKVSQYLNEDNENSCAFGSTEFFVLRARSGISDPSFIYYLSQTDLLRESAIQSMVGASGRQRADIKSLSNLILSLPNYDEQKRIGNFLSQYDDLIEKNRKRIALLEKSARLLYQEWFVKFRFPEYQQSVFKNEIPQDWLKGFVTDFVNILSGGTPNTKETRYWNGDIPFFTPKDCSDYVYVWNTEKMITNDGLEKCNSKLFNKDSVFITARGTVGKLALAQRPMAMNQSCYALVPKVTSNLDQFFLFLSIENSIKNIKTMASGGVFDAIVVDTFKNIPFLYPSPSLISKFGEIVHPIFRQIDYLLQEIYLLSQARDELLPKLISGRIKV